MKTAALTLLALLALAGCRHPQARDYDGVRQRSGEEHKSMDEYSKTLTSP